jgi:hypothetical protein
LGLAQMACCADRGVAQIGALRRLEPCADWSLAQIGALRRLGVARIGLLRGLAFARVWGVARIGVLRRLACAQIGVVRTNEARIVRPARAVPRSVIAVARLSAAGPRRRPRFPACSRSARRRASALLVHVARRGFPPCPRSACARPRSPRPRTRRYASVTLPTTATTQMAPDSATSGMSMHGALL